MSTSGGSSGGGSISEITSTGGTLTITDPEGPTTDLEGPAPANGYGITGNTGFTPTPAVDLATEAGVLDTSVALGVNTLTKVMDTASLAVGVWRVRFAVVIEVVDASASVGMQVALDSAEGSIAGPSATEVEGGAVGTGEVSLSVTVIATITTAGTLKMSAEGTGASGANALATGNQLDFPDVTGYTAVRIS